MSSELTPLGEGGFGSVYSGYLKAKDGTQQIAAAFKTLKTDTRENFEREISNLQALDHLFIIKFYGIYKIKSQEYVFMI